jgi:hypothetical protein
VGWANLLLVGAFAACYVEIPRPATARSAVALRDATAVSSGSMRNRQKMQRL